MSSPGSDSAQDRRTKASDEALSALLSQTSFTSPPVPREVVLAQFERAGCAVTDDAPVEVAGVATQFFLYDLLSRAEGNARRRAQASGMNVEDGVAIREEDVLRALRAKGIHAHRNEYFANEAIAPAAPAAASGTGRHQA